MPYTYTLTASNCTHVIWTQWALTAASPASVTIHYSPSEIYRTWLTNDAVIVPFYTPIIDPPAEDQHRSRRRIIRDEAEKRAEALLIQFLSEQQRKQWVEEQCFDVMSACGRRRYQLHRSWAGNIKVLDDKGRAIESLCVHPTKQMPIEDSLLAQKLMIETDEARLRKTANITRLAAA